MNNLEVRLLLVLYTVAILCNSKNTYGSSVETILHDGTERSFVIYQPADISNMGKYPLVITLHGWGTSGKTAEAYSGFNSVADIENFIAVYPDGSNLSGTQIWNAGGQFDTWARGADDVGFISALIDHMITNHPVDAKRVYLNGYSNGGFMAYQIAEKLSHKVTAVGVVAGSMSDTDCNPQCPVPIIHIHGLNDASVLYNGDINFPSAPYSIETWQKINNCSSSYKIIYNNDHITGKHWQSADSASDFVLYTSSKWGHDYPTADNWGFSATEIMYQFFKQQEKSEVIVSGTDNTHEISGLLKVYPNPFQLKLFIEIVDQQISFNNILIYNSQGILIELINKDFTLNKHLLSLNTRSYLPGIYYIKAISEGNIETYRVIKY